MQKTQSRKETCGGTETEPPALSQEQRAMVEKNLGLVGLHIRRNVRGIKDPRADRDFDDLFQEGCCGLIRAVRSFDPKRGIPFAAYALPRIHTAVSTALHSNASLVRTPRPRKRRADNRAGKLANSWANSRTNKSSRPIAPDPVPDPRATPPKVVSLDRDPVDQRYHTPWQNEAEDTIGDRIRKKYDAALELAARSSARRKAVRNDRKRLVERLIDQRLRVPEPTAKRSLREIAAETGSSYSRVLQCEKKLQEGVRRALGNDLEFQHLLRLSKAAPEGCAFPVDKAMLRDLRCLSAEAFWRRLILLDDAARDRALARLARAAGESGIKAFFTSLEESAAESLLAEVSRV